MYFNPVERKVLHITWKMTPVIHNGMLRSKHGNKDACIVRCGRSLCADNVIHNYILKRKHGHRAASVIRHP